jgi:tRNA modification GTPase
MSFEKDTIYAPASPSGGAICVIRISGENAHEVLGRVFNCADKLEHARLTHGQVVKNGRAADDVMAVKFDAPNSYTGEHMAEIHSHGGRVSVAGVLQALSEAGARIAQPGEFTKRAFLNGKMDLSAAGAVMELIEANSAAGASAALRQLSGGLFDKISAVQSKLTDALAIIEAGIEYPEDDIEADIRRDALPLMESALGQISKIADTFSSGRLLREGYNVVIAGRPNVGKSSLFNLLLEKERAIVTSTPGTTRDTVDDTFVIGGVLIRLMDTAGIRKGRDEAEHIGIERAKTAAKQADMTLFVIDGSVGVTDEDKKVFDRLGENTVVLVNKSDLPQKDTIAQIERIFKKNTLSVCAISGKGADEVLACIEPPEICETQDVVITNERHARILEHAKASLQSGIAAFETADLDCVTIDIKEAWDALGEITGVTVTQEIIDNIFDKFCLGK